MNAAIQGNAMDNSLVAVQTERVFRWWDYFLFALLTGLNVSAILYFFSYWFSLGEWPTYPATFFVMTLMLVAILSTHQLRWFLLPCMRRPKPMAVLSRWKVAVVTTFVPGAEPLEMLEETVRALVSLDYPHDTWVLDEGDDDQVKALCLKLGAYHFSRKNDPRYQSAAGAFQSRSKHGNYNAWLHEVGFDRYEIITGFDPDHVPDASFLSTVLGYFEDPKVGYVQAAQVYYNQKASFIARGAAEETYSYYSSMQMASYAMGYPIVTGCHNTHRVRALNQVGGFAAHDADDLLITCLYRAAGWEGVYVPQILAKGITPVDWNGYLTQQRRWARSVLDVKFRIYPTISSRLPIRTRMISFLHGLNYLRDGMMTSIGLLLMAVMLVSGSTPALSYLFGPNFIVLYGVLQLSDFYRQRFYLDWRREWGLHWRAAVLQFAKWPYFLLALFEVIRDRQTPYAMTPKVKVDSRRTVLLWPHLIVALVLCAAWAVAMLSRHDVHIFIHVWTAILVVGALTLSSTEFMLFPHPYDRKLRDQ